MPLDRAAAVQLGLLLLAVPVQFFISQYMSSTETQRSLAIKSLVFEANRYKDQLLSLNTWQDWCNRLLNRMVSWKGGGPLDQPVAQADEGLSPAVEVLQYENPQGHFAGSLDPRSPRPGHVKYKIGQVIKHKKYGYRGVIVGWDETAKAPEAWLKQMHGATNTHWRDMPNYSVLVDVRDRPDAQKTYVVEENIEVVSATKVQHPDMDLYFEHYDGTMYIPRPWLRRIYPFG